MLKRIRNFLLESRNIQRITYALARGSASSSARTVDLADPSTWEFAGFSQNGEDGILDVLLSQIIDPNRYFIEIGTSDGLENNTSWLAIVHKYSGLCIEGDPEKSAIHRRIFLPLNYGLSFQSLFVTRESPERLRASAITLTPDVFSLDIDGIDWHIAEAALRAGFRPRIFAVEYNSAFGPENAITVPYREDFRIGQTPNGRLYYGSSIAAWRCLFEKHDYQFVTVDRNGVNAFFAHKSSFSTQFLTNIQGLQFAENFSQRNDYRRGWEEQFSFIQARDFVSVSSGC